jgi:hypothetical protein
MKKARTFPIQFRADALGYLSKTPNFYPQVKVLRKHFETTFANPMEAKSERFCWDYWSVPNQYRLLRTPADAFFGKSEFKKFLEHLLAWGRENLGCQMVSQPWLSAYIDGSFQNLHSDVPHGPYSFVYSLTPWQVRKFTGGETLIAKPKLLRYFSELTSNTSHEETDLFLRVDPKFNQLTVFDPRYPHGVARVQGVENLLEARLVIHGWFTEPRPMLEGTLTPAKAQTALDKIAHHLLRSFEALPYSGLFSLRLEVETSGDISRATVLASHLLDKEGRVISKRFIIPMIESLSKFQFPKSSGRTRVTLSLMIDV